MQIFVVMNACVKAIGMLEFLNLSRASRVKRQAVMTARYAPPTPPTPRTRPPPPLLAPFSLLRCLAPPSSLLALAYTAAALFVALHRSNCCVRGCVAAVVHHDACAC